MRTKINEFVHSSFFIVTLTILSIFMVGITGTYAWFTWGSTDNTNLTMSIGSLGDVFFESGNDIKAQLSPVFNYYEGVSTTFSVMTREGAGASGNYLIRINLIDIPAELRGEDVKYVLLKNNDIVAEGDFSYTANGTSVNVYFTSMELGTTNYQLYLYIDANMENSNSMMNKTLVGEITLDLIDEVPTIDLISHITNLYDYNKDSNLVYNNEVPYRYASSVSLMNDRLGGDSSNPDAGNIRYYGANPNNYVDIGDVYKEDVTINNWDQFGAAPFNTSEGCYEHFSCSNLVGDDWFPDEETCEEELDEYLMYEFGVETLGEICDVTIIPKGTPILYRVIGLFKDVELEDGTKQDLVKIIRDDSIGKFAWDLVSDDSGYTYANDWSNSTLNSILNNEYFNSQSVNHVYYDISGINDVVNVTSDLSNTGLSSSSRSMIESVYWNLGGLDTIEGLYSDNMYWYERGTTVFDGMPTGWIGKVALMYPSDSGYATDFTKCSREFPWYDAGGCYVNDWLYDKSSWMLTPSSSRHDFGFDIMLTGVDGMPILFGISVRPTFFLKSGLDIEYGKGTKDNPYKIVKSSDFDDSVNLISHITDLYMNNKNTNLVSSNNVSYRYSGIYDKDEDSNSTGGLMNDRKGSMQVGEDDGNIRYYGKNPSNYIYFNCDDYNNPSDTTCELWRIIGIVDGKVKIVRDSVLDSTMQWSNGGSNNWEISSLNTYLNGEYYNSLKTTTTSKYIIINSTTLNINICSTNNTRFKIITRTIYRITINISIIKSKINSPTTRSNTSIFKIRSSKILITFSHNSSTMISIHIYNNIIITIIS